MSPLAVISGISNRALALMRKDQAVLKSWEQFRETTIVRSLALIQSLCRSREVGEECSRNINEEGRSGCFECLMVDSLNVLLWTLKHTCLFLYAATPGT